MKKWGFNKNIWNRPSIQKYNSSSRNFELEVPVSPGEGDYLMDKLKMSPTNTSLNQSNEYSFNKYKTSPTRMQTDGKKRKKSKKTSGLKDLNPQRLSCKFNWIIYSHFLFLIICRYFSNWKEVKL